MYQTQLLKIRIRPGKTERVVEFLTGLMDKKEASLEGLRREGMMVESLFLERNPGGDYLYYYVKARDLAQASKVNMQATDPLTLEIREFITETWGDVASPEPLLDLDLIPEEGANPAQPRRKPASTPPGPGAVPPHALAGG